MFYKIQGRSGLRRRAIRTSAQKRSIPTGRSAVLLSLTQKQKWEPGEQRNTRSVPARSYPLTHKILSVDFVEKNSGSNAYVKAVDFSTGWNTYD